jgi:hypothetical protein
MKVDNRIMTIILESYSPVRLSENMGTSVAMLEKHYGHTSNVASAAELTKGGNYKSDKKTK